MDVKFTDFPVIKEGESKIIHNVGNDLVAIRYKPTVYSYTANRTGVIQGTDTLRLRATKVFLDVLKNANIKHSYIEVFPEQGYVKAHRVFDTRKHPEFKINSLCQPPIEVVVKDFHVGTPKHLYYKMEEYSTLQGHFIQPNSEYSETIVRFDWRNPLQDENGNRLADQVLPEQMAAWWIDVPRAKATASLTFKILNDFLRERGIVMKDICFIISDDGETICSEISSDCGRFSFEGESLDKDLWRNGSGSELVLEKWQQFVELIEK